SRVGLLAQVFAGSQGPDRIEEEACLEELARQLPAPGAGGVEGLVLHTAKVRGELDPFLVERTDALAAELGDGETELEDRGLPRARTEVVRLRGQRTEVVAGQENDGEGDRRLRFELLDQGASAGGLLVEDDRFQSELHEVAGNLLLHLGIPSVDDPHL